MEFILEYPM